MVRVDLGEQFISWALADLEREVKSNFRLLRTIRNDHIYRLIQRLGHLPPPNRRDYMRAVFLRFHGHEVEPVYSDYLRDYESVLRPTGEEPWLVALREEPGSPLLKRHALKKMLTDIGEADCGELVFADESLLRYHERLQGGTLVETQFDVGGRFHTLSYSHRLIRGEYSSGQISFLSWLGISSQTSWKFVLHEDADVLTDAIKEMVALFKGGCGLLSGSL